jgi:hypothetical protein
VAEEPADKHSQGRPAASRPALRVAASVLLTLVLAALSTGAGALFSYLAFRVAEPLVTLLTVAGSEVYSRLGWHIGRDFDLGAARVAGVMLIFLGLTVVYVTAWGLCRTFRGPFGRGAILTAAFTLPLLGGTFFMISIADSLFAVCAIGLIVVAGAAAAILGAVAGHRGVGLFRKAARPRGTQTPPTSARPAPRACP